ncbi:hypothetical protein LK09_06100 [Microbacterium mangrovi]|uniref:Phage tail tape measure protein domain-containing protein n=2 Tax=Microbacterium mangrovi TaxID=1348253 RepID=A0A0B2A639_9MICO|nr:hypothetical protein LK09_06100 [Microbacterium mangrovi]
MGRAMSQVQKIAAGLRTELNATGTAAKASAADAKVASTAWGVMEARIKSVTQATREAAQQQYLQKFGAKAFPANTSVNAMTAEQKKAYTAAVDANQISAYSQANNALNGISSTAPRARYALYDVATTATITAVALTALGVGAIKASTDFDWSFANVRRTMDETSDGSAAKLKGQLIGLTRQIPQSFGDIAKISTLANQLGVPASQLVATTQTIAKFSTVSGISAEESAKAFGSLGTILGFTGRQYSNFASAVELVGRKSAATDADILSMTKDIGQQAKQAGFNAYQVVGLAGALAQLRVAPERARGSLTTYFGTLNKAVADGDANLQKLASMSGKTEGEVLRLAQSGANGMKKLSDATGLSSKQIASLITSNGQKLQAFSLITGIAADKLSAMVRAGKGVEVFQAFLNGLKNQGDIVNVTKALDTLGLSQLRVSDTFTRLSSNQQVFTQYMGLAKQGYTQNTELNRQYAIVLDTVAAKWQLFLNALQEFGATVGTSLGPAVAALLTQLTDLLHVLSDFAATPFGKFVVEMVTGVGTLVAVLASVVGIAALGAASLLAVRSAVSFFSVAARESATSTNGFVASLLGIAPATETASTGLKVFKGALVATGVGALAVGLGYVIQLFTDFGAAMTEAQGPVNFFIDLVYKSAAAFDGLVSSITGALGALPGGGAFKDYSKGILKTGEDIEKAAGHAHASFNQWVADQQKVQSSVDPTTEATNTYGNSVDALNKKLQENLNASNKAVGGTKKVADTATKAAVQIRTLVDYSNDLSTVMKRATDIRFGPQEGLDAIASGWNAIKKNVDDAKKAIVDAQAKIRSLTSDKQTKEYQVKIAVLYGDNTQANSLRAGISDINNQIASSQSDIKDAQAKASGSLKGNSDAAIQNRAALLQLVGSYQDYITKLAASGVGQDVLKQKVAQAKQEFLRQATQLGFSRTEVQKYTVSFNDMTVAINGVPKNVNVRANANPAIQALNELKAHIASVTNNGKGYKIPVTASVNSDSLAKFARGQAIVAKISALQSSLGAMKTVSTDSQISRKYDLQQQIDALTKKINSGSYRGGGYTGDGSVDDIAGVTHRREFVFDAQATANATPQTLAFLQDAFRSGKGFNFSQSGSGRMDPRDIDDLARRIAYYGPSLEITRGELSRAVRGSNRANYDARRF